MTAEIAIMNKMAVALAADSAVTIRTGGTGLKIYHTNKLFMLSKYQPIGLMLFSDAEMMRLPWESIVKTYRQELADKSFNTLEDYGRHFISYLNNASELFPEAEQEYWLFQLMNKFLRSLRKSIDSEIEATTKKSKGITDDQVKTIAGRVIRESYRRLESVSVLKTVPSGFSQNVLKKYDSMIQTIIGDNLGGLPLPKTSASMLRRYCEQLLSKDREMPSYSGVVIAGFGVKDLFPSLISYQIEGMVNNTLRWRQYGNSKIERENTATVVPFAQAEMVWTFMEGLDPSYKEFLRQYLTSLFDKYPEDLLKKLPKLTQAAKKTILAEAKLHSDTLVEDLFSALLSFTRGNHVYPVIGTVAFLPVVELASMAESLVNLTSFKRRITMVAETVGGPIDVAVISKGDGFIWIKRKHYFESQSNQQFYANYYR
jgi:hypothetical protein